MAAKLTRLTHEIVTRLHLAADSHTIAVLFAGGQSGNFWIHLRMMCYSPSLSLWPIRCSWLVRKVSAFTAERRLAPFYNRDDHVETERPSV